jgi:hypothetical protein
LICDPGFFDPVASKELNHAVGLWFATLVGRLISVAGKGLKAIVGRRQWAVRRDADR